MSVFERALKSIALTLSDEAELYNVELPQPPDGGDDKAILEYLKEVAKKISEASGSTVADACLETLEKYLSGSASDEDILTNCPMAEELPNDALEPFRKRF